MFKKITTKLAVPVLLTVSGAASAVEGTGTTSGGVDLSPLTNSIDFSTVLVAIMAVAASLVTLYAGVAGVRWVLRTVKSA